MVDELLICDSQKTLVRLAPIGFLEDKEFVAREGDVVSLSGYRMSMAEGRLLVAIEVRRSNQTLRLRHSPEKPARREGAQ
jgi:hypothetical protein